MPTRPDGSIRGDGTTTRLADTAIQELFTKGEAMIEDHYHYHDTRSTIRLLDIVKVRLAMEHPGISFIVKKEGSHLWVKLRIVPVVRAVLPKRETPQDY